MVADVSSPSSPRSEPLTVEDWTLVERPTADDVSASPGPARPASPELQPVAETAAEHEEQLDGMKSPESERLADDLLREPFQAGGVLHMQLLQPPTASTVEEPSTPTAAAGPYSGSCDNLALPHLHRNDAAAAAAALAAFASSSSNTTASPDSSSGAGPSTSSAPVAGPSSGSATAATSAPACPSSSSSPAAPLCGWSFERHRERLRLRAASRLSGEGALEGFQDSQDTLLADAAAAKIAGGSGQDSGAADDTDTDSDAASDDDELSGTRLSHRWEELVAGFCTDLLREWADVRSMLASTAAAMWDRVLDGQLALNEAVRQAAKTAGRSSCPLWALLGASGVAAAALALLFGQLCSNRRLASQLRQRDRDLARLVVKILNLQDALHSAARSAAPLLRHTACESFTTTTLINMVPHA